MTYDKSTFLEMLVEENLWSKYSEGRFGSLEWG